MGVFRRQFWVVPNSTEPQMRVPARMVTTELLRVEGIYFVRRGYFGSAKLSHSTSTFSRVLKSLTISSGHGRVNPSVGHLRVASTPIFEPKSWMRAAWSDESTGPI